MQEIAIATAAPVLAHEFRQRIPARSGGERLEIASRNRGACIEGIGSRYVDALACGAARREKRATTMRCPCTLAECTRSRDADDDLSRAHQRDLRREERIA